MNERKMHRNGERQCVGKGQRESERLKKRERKIGRVNFYDCVRFVNILLDR